jgi:hypothetical protein
MVMELALVNLARAHTLGNIEEMLSRLESVEARLQGRPAPAGSAAPTISSAPSPSPEQPAAAAAPPPRTGGADAQVKEQPATSAEPGAYLPHAALWEDLLKAVQENGNTWVHMHLLRGWLKEARPPNGRAPGRLVVAVPDRRVLQELDAPKARAELEKALSRVLKGPVELSFVLDAETRGGLKEKDSAPDEEAARIAEIFGGQVVKRRKAPNG